MAEQEFKRVRAFNFGGEAPSRPDGHKPSIAKIDSGYNQTTWLLVPDGLRIAANRSDYAHWLERIVRLLGNHADAQGRRIITLRNNLAESRKANRELLERLSENDQSAPATTTSTSPSQAQLDASERANLDLRKEVEELTKALDECRRHGKVIDASSVRKRNDAEERQAQLEAQRLLQIVKNINEFILDVNEVALIDDIEQHLAGGSKHNNTDLVITTSNELRLVYVQRGSGKCTVHCSSTNDAEELIKSQTIELDKSGRLSEQQLDILKQLNRATTHDGKVALQTEIDAKRYREIYG